MTRSHGGALPGGTVPSATIGSEKTMRTSSASLSWPTSPVGLALTILSAVPCVPAGSVAERINAATSARAHRWLGAVAGHWVAGGAPAFEDHSV